MKEVWIKDQSNFEAAQLLKEPLRIEFEPRTFTARHHWPIPSHSIVHGNGARIESDLNRTEGIFLLGTDWREDGHTYISDLTLNAKFSLIGPNIPLANRKIDGLVLFGSHDIAERITCMDWGGTMESEQEAYGIILASRSENKVNFPSTGSRVRDCIVHGGSGTYGNGIGVGPLAHDALVEGCTVYDVRPVGGTGHGSGIAVSGTATIKNNTTHGCQWGFYSEAADAVTLDGNRFLDCVMRGARLHIGAEDTIIIGNRFEMSDHRNGAIVIEMVDDREFTVTGSKILNNTFRGTNVVIKLSDKTAVCHGNRGPLGELIASLPDNPAVMPDKIPKHWKAKLRKTL